MKKTKKQLENEIHHRNSVKELQSILGEVYLGGGKKRLEKKKSEGKLTARERISYLLDKNTPYQEIGALTAHNQYQDHGGCASAGVITILGYVNKRLCIVVANDSTVKAGAWFPLTAKKNLRAQEIAIENKIPILYLVDSAGIYLPLKMKFLPIRIILEEFSEIMRN
jgi:acetyl-CoA carboxylase carboxyltransferase component